MTSAAKAIRTEIDRREKELASLRQALAALTGGAKPGKGRAVSSKRRAKTAAEKKLLSEKMKAAWKRRKAAAKAASK
jgi:hypothetical protein